MPERESNRSKHTCPTCGYDLAGLDAGGRCPECGKPIRQRRSGAGIASLTDEPIGYLRTLSAGLSALAVSGPALVMSSGMLAGGPSGPRVQIVAAVSAFVWAVGVWMVMVKPPARPPIDELVPGLRRVTREAARWSQTLLWGGSIALFLAGPQIASAQLATLADVTARLLLLGGLFGFVPMCIVLADVADYANDSALGDKMRGVAWVLALCGTAVVGGTLIGPALPGLGNLLLVGSVLAAFAVVLSLLFFGVLQLMLANLAVDAIRSSRYAGEVADRRLRRVEREQAERPESAVERVCVECGEDLRGLPAGARCPSCGYHEPVPVHREHERDEPEESVSEAERAAARAALGTRFQRIERAGGQASPYDLEPEEDV